MTKDEEFFLPIWYRYYSAQLGAENVFVIDHDSNQPVQTPGAPGVPLPNVLRLPFSDVPPPKGKKNTFDANRFSFLSSIVNGLLVYYDTVIFNDTDEMFVPDPARFSSLRAYLDDPRNRFSAIAGMGLEIIHDPETEAPLDVNRPVLSQRRNFLYDVYYAKPHVISKACRLGAHGVSMPFRFDPDLYLLHLKNVDMQNVVARQARLHAAYEQGLGGKDSDWQLTPEQKEKQFGRFMALPEAGQELRHHALMPRFLDGKADKLIGAVDGPPRLRSRKNDKIRLDDFVSQENIKLLRSQRNVLPKRFIEVE